MIYHAGVVFQPYIKWEKSQTTGTE